MIRWIAGFQGMALAAAANEVSFIHVAHASLRCARVFYIQVWPYTASMAHLRICMEIAVTSHCENRSHMLAQIYDEICRKDWGEKAFRGRQTTYRSMLFVHRFACQVIRGSTLQQYPPRRTKTS